MTLVIGFSLYLVTSSTSKQTILLATTTSVANSRLLDKILPDFEKKYNVMVKVLPVGTGQAIEMGKRGDVDIILVHAPIKEKEFVSHGYGTKRYQVCYNYFVIIGPPSDPADVGHAQNITEALNRIFNTHSKFISRGDESGTHTKEKLLWKAAGFDYTYEIDILDKEWYFSVCAGMGDTIIRANELEAYTLSDEGTFWAYNGDLALRILLRDDPDLLNQYSVIPVNSEKFSHVEYDLVMNFVKWITSPETRERIGNFTNNGHQLFTPTAETSP